MIKGINKRIVEIPLNESEYFEKAVMFVRPDIPEKDDCRLAQAAKSSAADIEAQAVIYGMKRSRPTFRQFMSFLFRSAARLAVIICAVLSMVRFWFPAG